MAKRYAAIRGIGYHMYLVNDLEATCFEQHGVKDKNEIIEIGIVVCDKGGLPVMQFQSFVKPTINPRLSRFCKKLTGIKQDWVDLADPLDTVLNNFQSLFKSKFTAPLNEVPWTSYGTMDFLCLKNDCERRSLPLPFGHYVDLKKLFAAYSGFRNCGMLDCLKIEGLEIEGDSHRALSDAINASKVAKIFAPRIMAATIEDSPLHLPSVPGQVPVVRPDHTNDC